MINKRINRKFDFLSLIFFIGIGLLMALGNRFYFRYDLTKDKRYSIQPSTKSLLSKLDHELSVNIYLDGILPVDLKYLKQTIQELFEELNANTKKYKINYKFVDLDSESDENKKACIKKFKKYGINATNLQFKQRKKTIDKILYPVAVLEYNGRESADLLLKSKTMSNLSQMVIQSIETLEYEVSNAIEKLITSSKLNVALLRSHGTPREEAVSGLVSLLKGSYLYHDLYLSDNSNLDISSYNAIVIVRPTEEFSDNQKYLLDQYIMHGGKVLFFIDALSIDMASIYAKMTLGMPFTTGLEDLFYKYGIRINQDLIKDFQCSIHPFIVGVIGNQPQMQLLQWPFAPIITHFPEHLITRNLDAISTQFISSLSATNVNEVELVAILYTSPYTIQTMAPVYVNIEGLRTPPDKDDYRDGYIPIACMLEGEFNSAYRNEIILPSISGSVKFVAKSPKTKIFVAATSSIVTNVTDLSGKKFIKWGYDPYMKQQFSNKEFVLNTLKYMLSNDGTINMKKKSHIVRFLDRVKVETYRTQIQLIAIIFPILIILLFGLFWNFFYRRKYTKNS
jgi:ABC-2 type transport system permease protein